MARSTEVFGQPSLPVYLDMETVPDESRQHLWGVPEGPDTYPLLASLIE